jgi:ATP-dependent protease ClpP protease subunit
MARLLEPLKGKKYERYKDCNRKIIFSVRPNAPTSPSEEQEGTYEQEQNWHTLVMEQASKSPKAKAEFEAIGAAARNVRAILSEIERLRKSVVIAYFADQGGEKDGTDTNVAFRDIARLDYLLRSNHVSAKKLDFIIDSPGGDFHVGQKLVQLLRDRFEEVNFLVPREAFSVASLMAMSADTIILGKSGSLGMYDPIIEFDGAFTQSHILFEVAQSILDEMKWRFWRRFGYQGWTASKARMTMKGAWHDIRRTKYLAALWLTKYMFKHSEIEINYHDLALEREPLAVKNNLATSSDYAKAERIASFFVGSGSGFDHKAPLMYSAICDLGLNLERADETLDDLMWKAHAINDEQIFERFDVKKTWYSSTDYRFFSPTLSPRYCVAGVPYDEHFK